MLDVLLCRISQVTGPVPIYNKDRYPNPEFSVVLNLRTDLHDLITLSWNLESGSSENKDQLLEEWFLWRGSFKTTEAIFNQKLE